MKRAALIALFALPLLADTPAPPPPSTPASQVTLPLADYETLRNATQKPDATVIDTVRVGGTFRGRDLTITFSGQTIGNRPQADVLDSTNDVTIAGCSGAAILTRQGQGRVRADIRGCRRGSTCRRARAGASSRRNCCASIGSNRSSSRRCR
jgi:hypothetical protein